jgi:hypothetical protein
MTRLEWPPTLGCEDVWRERVEVIAGSGANFPKGWADWTNHFVIRLTGEVPLTPSGQPGVYTGEGPVDWAPNSEITAHETGWFYEIPTDTRCDYTRKIVAVGFRPGTARVRLTVGPRDPANPAGPPPLDLEFTLDAVAEDLEDTWVVTAPPTSSTPGSSARTWVPAANAGRSSTRSRSDHPTATSGEPAQAELVSAVRAAYQHPPADNGESAGKFTHVTVCTIFPAR